MDTCQDLKPNTSTDGVACTQRGITFQGLIVTTDKQPDMDIFRPILAFVFGQLVWDCPFEANTSTFFKVPVLELQDLL